MDEAEFIPIVVDVSKYGVEGHSQRYVFLFGRVFFVVCFHFLFIYFRRFFFGGGGVNSTLRKYRYISAKK